MNPRHNLVSRAFLALLASQFLFNAPALRAAPADSSKDVTLVQTQPPEKDWSFTLSPYGWLTGISGTIVVGNRTAPIDIHFTELLKHLDMAFMMAGEIRYKRWSLAGDLFYARVDANVAPPAGILFSSTHEVLKEWLGTAELTYRLVDGKPKGFVDVFAGARVYSVYSQIVLRANFARQGVNVSDTVTWADPIVGLRGRYYLSRAWFLNGYGDIGGFGLGSQVSWQVLGGVGVQATRWCDVQLGYRALGFNYDVGPANLDITMHGPIMGATIHF